MEFLENLYLVEESNFFKASALAERDFQKIKNLKLIYIQMKDLKLLDGKIFSTEKIIYFMKNLLLRHQSK